MAEQPALPQVHGIRLRVTQLDQNGVPTPGTDQMYVTDCLTKVSLSPEYESGSELRQKNAQGNLCLHYKSADSLVRYGMEVELCSQDPYLTQMLSAGKILTDSVSGPAGDRTGWAAPALGPIVDDGGLSIEVWARRVDDGEEDVDSPYAWWVYPRAKNWKIGDYAHEDGPNLPKFSAEAYENPNWLDGPLNDWQGDSDRVAQWLPTHELPTATVGYIDVAAS